MEARPLRAWQREALAAYGQAGARDFLVTATPGAGKTTFALTVAEQLLTARAIDRVIVVCPTDHLRTQWADAAHRAGLELDPTLSNSVGPLRPGMHGYVTTYAQVAAKPMLHRGRCEARRTLVVLDEIHHAGDGLSWGEAVGEAFEIARRRLALTGTPFRTRADERIPFVRYVGDSDGGLASDADYTYGYREALADGVVRPVVFAAYTGVARWRNNAGEVISASLSEQNTRDVEMSAWRTALDPSGEWVPHVIAAMDDRISHLRAAGVPDAAGLVLASDQEAARAYAGIVTRVTGEEPALILSDDPKASEKIKEFTTSNQRIAVCVRMISEGVDVVRASCLAWMTSYRTPLFFAQAVGRVVRARTPGESATVFLPAVRPLLALAASLETERNHVIPPPPPSDEGLDPLPRPEREPSSTLGWEALHAEAEFAHILHGGRAVTAAAGVPRTGESGPDAASADDEDYLGLPGLLSAEQTANLLSRRDAEVRRRVAGSRRPAEHSPPSGAVDGSRPAADGPAGRVSVPRPTTSADEAAWESATRLRREINSLVGRVAASTRTPHAVVHARIRGAVPGPPSAAAPVEILARRRDHLMSML
ncbi:MAG: DEAD/DEAH box helicase [Frankia sp.]